MKMKNKTHRKIRTIRSLHDLELEKTRLKMDILKKEDQIKGNYREIVGVFTFKNIISIISQEIISRTSTISSAFTVGKSIFSIFKKKKKSKGKGSPEETTTKEPVVE